MANDERELVDGLHQDDPGARRPGSDLVADDLHLRRRWRERDQAARINVTWSLSGVQKDYTLQWATDTCAQANHGC